MPWLSSFSLSTRLGVLRKGSRRLRPRIGLPYFCRACLCVGCHPHSHGDRLVMRSSGSFLSASPVAFSLLQTMSHWKHNLFKLAESFMVGAFDPICLSISRTQPHLGYSSPWSLHPLTDTPRPHLVRQFLSSAFSHQQRSRAVLYPCSLTLVVWEKRSLHVNI